MWVEEWMVWEGLCGVLDRGRGIKEREGEDMKERQMGTSKWVVEMKWCLRHEKNVKDQKLVFF